MTMNTEAERTRQRFAERRKKLEAMSDDEKRRNRERMEQSLGAAAEESGGSLRQQLWLERLHRELLAVEGLNCGPMLGKRGIELHHEILAGLTEGHLDEDDERRVWGELEVEQRRAEDEAAKRLGLPPRPR
jgi:hypothetical protein